MGCCFSIGYGALMKPCCLNIINENVKSNTCLSPGSGKEYYGGAVGWRQQCPGDSDQAERWIKQQQMARQNANNGCCFSIGYGSLMIPCCLKTSNGPKEDCLIGPRIGGATGWSPTCPSNAKEAHNILNKSIRK